MQSPGVKRDLWLCRSWFLRTIKHHGLDRLGPRTILQKLGVADWPYMQTWLADRSTWISFLRWLDQHTSLGPLAFKHIWQTCSFPLFMLSEPATLYCPDDEPILLSDPCINVFHGMFNSRKTRGWVAILCRADRQAKSDFLRHPFKRICCLPWHLHNPVLPLHLKEHLLHYGSWLVYPVHSIFTYPLSPWIAGLLFPQRNAKVGWEFIAPYC